MRREAVAIPGPNLTLCGWLHVPAAGGPHPALILLHGWGPEDMNGAECLEESAIDLAHEGYVVLALSMRGWPETGGADDGGAEQPADTGRAVDWLSRQPCVNPSRISLIGFSQGGQVALLTAALGAALRAVVAWYPVTDVRRWGETSCEAGIRDGYVPEVCSAGPGLRARSPVFSASRIDVPVLLIHGDCDGRVPTQQSLLMERALREAGKRVELILVPGMDHGKASWPEHDWGATWRRMLTFLEHAME